jgi:hypothetical protein
MDIDSLVTLLIANVVLSRYWQNVVTGVAAYPSLSIFKILQFHGAEIFFLLKLLFQQFFIVKGRKR